ncbi:MAG: Hsp20/alpha crystallin family protein [Deltaproteobacteria bacterium]|nr:Hsp20/alpha crystallin family protein [Candidatus Zymogenaceae bacterium]
MTRYRWYVDRSPFVSEFGKLQREMTRLWDQVYPQEASSEGTGVFPLVNIREDHDNYYVSAEIPGVDEKDLDITVASDSLTIKGERTIDIEAEVSYHRRERNAGKFSRVLTLNNRIDSDKVEASLKHGVLTVTIGKAEETKPKQITIKAS